MPKVLDVPGNTKLDLAGWVKSEELAGQPMPSGQEVLAVLQERMGDGGAVLAGLTAGLARERAQVIPSMRTAMENAKGDPTAFQITAMSGVFSTMEHMGTRLRVAALAGDRQRVVDLTGIMTRLSEGMGADPLLVSSLVSTAMDTVTLKALQEGLQCPSLTDTDYVQIAHRLRRVQDLERQRKSFEMMALISHASHVQIVRMVEEGDYSRVNSIMSGGMKARWPAKLYRWGPRGWLDFNHASIVNFGLTLTGADGEEGWRSAIHGLSQVNSDLVTMQTIFKSGEYYIANPRRLMAAVEMPAMSGIWKQAVQNLIMRRSAVLTCALQRHRLQHGSFPEDLAGLDKTVLPEPMLDPAWEGKLLNYRRTEKGFVVWSVGEDRTDDGGDPVKDWTWVQEG